MEKKIDMIYFADMADDTQEEAQTIKEMLWKDGMDGEIEVQETPKWMNQKFDVLFFDWGGMSIGNSMLDHFCRYIIKNAIEHPSRLYIMMSRMTTWAMCDALEYMGDNKPSNIYLEYKDAVPFLKIIWADKFKPKEQDK